MATFPALPPTTFAVSYAQQPTVVQLGGPYSQRTIKGINLSQKIFDLTWSVLDAETGQEIIDFFDALVPGEQFFWVDPYGTTYKVFCNETPKISFQEMQSSITLKFYQDFSYVPS